MARKANTEGGKDNGKLKTKAKRNKLGRPKGSRKKINYRVLNRLCEIQCTGEECAAVLGIDYDTLNNTLKKEQGKGFKEYFAEKSAKGRRSLRRKQWSVAMSGDKTMLIWLGKQYLNQAEKHELSGKGGGPITQKQVPILDLSLLTDEELALAEKLGLKAEENDAGSNPG